MKLESLVGLGINDIPNGLGRVTRPVPQQTSFHIKARLYAEEELREKVFMLARFEKKDHTGIYTNEVKPEPPKFGTVDSDGRWLAGNIKESVPRPSEVPFITGSTPTEKGWYNATLYDDTHAFRYWHGTHWSDYVDMFTGKHPSKPTLKKSISTVEDGIVTKWRMVPLLPVFYEVAKEYERSKEKSELRDWNEGAPPVAGWYYASIDSCLGDQDYLRYWDGEGWTYGGSEPILCSMVDPATGRLKVNTGDVVYRRVHLDVKIVWLNRLDKPIPDWLVFCHS